MGNRHVKPFEVTLKRLRIGDCTQLFVFRLSGESVSDALSIFIYFPLNFIVFRYMSIYEGKNSSLPELSHHKYLDLFPREDIVYLSPHAQDDLEEVL